MATESVKGFLDSATVSLVTKMTCLWNYKI